MKTVKIIVVEDGIGRLKNTARKLINAFLVLPWHNQVKVIRHI